MVKRVLPVFVTGKTDWPKVPPVPNMGADPLQEFFEVGSGREILNAGLRVFHLHEECRVYSVAMTQSTNPGEDGFYNQARIWWDPETGGVAQELTLPGFIREFMRLEEVWWQECGESKMMRRNIWGATEKSAPTIHLRFALMRETHISGGTRRIEYRLWSYPFPTGAQGQKR